jgi:hypothetical protein
MPDGNPVDNLDNHTYVNLPVDSTQVKNNSLNRHDVFNSAC